MADIKLRRLKENFNYYYNMAKLMIHKNKESKKKIEIRNNILEPQDKLKRKLIYIQKTSTK